VQNYYGPICMNKILWNTQIQHFMNYIRCHMYKKAPTTLPNICLTLDELMQFCKLASHLLPVVCMIFHAVLWNEMCLKVNELYHSHLNSTLTYIPRGYNSEQKCKHDGRFRIWEETSPMCKYYKLIFVIDCVRQVGTPKSITVFY